ncbi:MAG: PQQ-dependent sugar dehydrogenase, partial [Pirellulales bacterium]
MDQSKLSIATERSFKNLSVRRPIVLTHAGDGTNRVFIASEHGVIHVLPNDQGVEKTTVFLDIEKKVTYKDKQNEEGFLGLAFHPDYKKNGQFFVYYSTKDAAQTSVISRFRVTSDDPNRADPASEEELMRIKQPFWNHNGGNILFGPDGCLYIGLGDGGSARDPKGNGQNRATLLGNILRIDVDRKDDGKKYAIPKDNPFVGMKDARPEIWAWGFRNPWGMTFDAETGLFWVADVGQDIWEEVNIVQKGGNYGWNLREAKHKFGDKGSGPRDDLIDPIWEYDHKVGKSITGGRVYRGKWIKQLVGAYLYADYVSGK